ncbi:hypothetical protein AVEN_34936-1 [Araneus ventricosus]|uniref:Uncharacterized protein n=1 Tax=Araneus ventricosus TaxID=182803 RepID=A0A4Y2G9C6_ARAVE|nr:hypothetical protein AVEN_34936-1 [Araneus ventricosus]
MHVSSQFSNRQTRWEYNPTRLCRINDPQISTPVVISERMSLHFDQRKRVKQDVGQMDLTRLLPFPFDRLGTLNFLKSPFFPIKANTPPLESDKAASF